MFTWKGIVAERKNHVDKGGSRLSATFQDIHEKNKRKPLLEERVLLGRINYKKFTLFHFHNVAKACAQEVNGGDYLKSYRFITNFA